MKLKTVSSKVVLLGGLILLNTSCATFFDTLFVNGGVNVANQSIDNEYSPDGESIASLQVSSEQHVQDQNGISGNLVASATSGPFSGESQDAILGYFAGVGTTIPLSSKLAARSELRFTRKGSKTEINANASNTTRLSYIDVPLQLEYRIKPKWSILGGLQPSILLGANMKSEVNGESSSRSVKDFYRTFDLAGTVGLGYDFNKNIGIRLGYDLGLLNVEEQADFQKVYNRSIRLGVQYTLKN